MKKNNVEEILVPFDSFFEVIKLNETDLEKKRQDLLKYGAIVKVDGQDRVSPRKCAKWVLEKLKQLQIRAIASRSHDDLLGYAFAAIDYFRAWSYFLAVMGPPPKETSPDASFIDSLKKELTRIMDDYHKIYEHLHTAISVTLEINISADTEKSEDQERIIADKDCATISIPLDFFTEMVKLNGPELEERHRDLGKTDIIVEFNGTEYVMLSRYILHVLDDLDFLYLTAEKNRSEKAIEDYVIFAETYLEIWARLMLGRSQFETSSGDDALNISVRDAWKNALKYFRAIYGHVRKAIDISLESGPLASPVE